MLSIKSEGLNKRVILGEPHLRSVVHCYVAHDHTARDHQGRGHERLISKSPHRPANDGRIVCNERIGGLLKYYRRAA